MQIKAINDQYLIQIEQSAIELADLQKMLNYLRFKSIVSRSQATDANIEQIADEITQSGWDSVKAQLMSRIGQ